MNIERMIAGMKIRKGSRYISLLLVVGSLFLAPVGCVRTDEQEKEYPYCEGDCQNGMGIVHIKTLTGNEVWTIEGQYTNGQLKGKVIMKFPDGVVYRGGLLDMEPSGPGERLAPGRPILSGNWLGWNVVCVQGDCVSGSGAVVFVGRDAFRKYITASRMWVTDLYQGIIWQDYDEYRGTFKDGDAYGEGRLFRNNEEIYSGRWEDGRFVKDK